LDAPTPEPVMIRFSPRLALPLALYLLAGALLSAGVGSLSRPLGSVLGLGFALVGGLLGLTLAALGWTAQARRRLPFR
jgi:hypothetical protein